MHILFQYEILKKTYVMHVTYFSNLKYVQIWPDLAKYIENRSLSNGARAHKNAK